MFNALRKYFFGLLIAVSLVIAQEPAGTPVQQQRITGTITAIDPATHVAMVKEDKTGTEYSIELQNTKSFRKVDPASLDLKKATRITADDLMTGDRVQVFAIKAEDNPNSLAARGVILISARELQSVRQQQAAAWQHASRGVITTLAGDGKFSMSQRTGTETKTVTVDAQKANFIRYSVADPKVPAPSNYNEIQVGDQVRVIGEAGGDGSTLTAQQVYSSPIRMLVGTVNGVAADGKSLTMKDLQSKQSVTIALNDNSVLHKLPEMMAMGLARRLNPAAAGNRPDGAVNGGTPASGSSTSNVQAGAKQGEAATPADGAHNWRANGGGAGGSNSSVAGSTGDGAPGGGSGAMRPAGGMRNGDLSQMLDRVPKISAADLKAGDAIMVAGIPVNNDKSHLIGTTVIAGVEPIFQAASPRQMQSLGDWGLSAGAGGADGMSQQ